MESGVESVWREWKTVRLLGEGSFGKVYEIVRDQFGLEEHSAVKVIGIPATMTEVQTLVRDGMTQDNVVTYYEGVVKDIVGEIALMSKLRGHAHIVSYEDYAVVERKDRFGWDIYIRMERLTSLPSYIDARGGVFDNEDVVRLATDLCLALEVCGARNIVHRDIKPDNIFVSEDGHFKLGDFGVAKTVEKTVSGLSKKGTPIYMAPEIYKGEPGGTNSDLYSLGIVMYKLLNHNREPFLPPFPQEVTFEHKQQGLVRRMNGEALPPLAVDSMLNAVVQKACAHSPKDRYQSPTAMKRDLAAIGAAATPTVNTVAVAPAAVVPAPKITAPAVKSGAPAKKKKLWLVALLAALVMAAVGVTVWWLIGNGGEAPLTSSVSDTPSDAQSQQAQYDKALVAVAAGKYQTAYDLFTALGDYQDAKAYLDRFEYVLSNEVIQYSYGSSGTYENTYDYDADGNRIKEKCTNSKEGYLGTTEYTNDEHGKIVQWVLTNVENEKQTGENKYDDRGNCIERLFVSEGKTTKYEYTYDDHDNVIEEVWSVDGTERDRQTYEYTYDADGNKTKVIQTASSGYRTTASYSYDAAGKLTEKVVTSSDGYLYTTEYMYDEHGRCVKETVIYPDDRQNTNEYTYDEHGNMIQSVTVNSVGTETHECTYRLIYKPE